MKKDKTVENLRVMQDAQILLRQTYGGVSRYHFEIYKGLIKRGIKVDVPVLFSSNKYYEGYLYRHSYNKLYKNRFIRYVTYLLNDLYSFIKISNSIICKKKYDVIHLTWYASIYPALIKRIFGSHSPAIVVTVHDMIHELSVDQSNLYKRVSRQKKKMLDICDYCICVSNNTRKDLLNLYPYLEHKSCVVYHGYYLTKEESGCSKQSDRYILYVGKREGYKNFGYVCNVMELLKDEDIICMCVGEDFTPEEEHVFLSKGIQDKMVSITATDSELRCLYHNAVCLIYPSLYEGFGLPILEAFGNRCPVVLTNKSCFPEIAGDAAIYVDGINSDEAAQTVRTLVKDTGKRDEMTEKGIERLKAFSWENAVDGTIDAYKEAIESR